MGESIRDLGEKAIISRVILPMVNPSSDIDLAGDDCAIVGLPSGEHICISTDRVPWDLIAFRIGLIDFAGLGNFLAVMNLSDLAAMGAKPLGMVVNLGLPGTFEVDALKSLMAGVLAACGSCDTRVLGGDISDSPTPSISATVIGFAPSGRFLRRSGALTGDIVYCSGYVGLTPTAFAYYLEARSRGLVLSEDDEDLLRNQFCQPVPRLALGLNLSGSNLRVTAMDNTDGLGQTLCELADASGVAFDINARDLPIHPVSQEVATFLERDVHDLILGPGADFQLVGTIGQPEGITLPGGLVAIGKVGSGRGVKMNGSKTGIRQIEPNGWNYFAIPPLLDKSED